MTTPRFAVCTAAVGAGHSQAAKAIAQSLREAAHVDLIEALDAVPRWFTFLYRDVFVGASSHLPSIVGRLYRSSDSPMPIDGHAARVQFHALRTFVSRPEIRDADVLVTTHFLCAQVLTLGAMRGMVHAPLVVCVTDQHPHAVWITPGVEALLVASDEARATALAAGVPEGRVHVTGIPIRPDFGMPVDAGTVRARHAFPLDRPIILLSGGGLGLGGLDQSLQPILSSNAEVHAVVVCGNNEQLRASLAPFSRAPTPASPSCTILGFSHDMPDLMGVASVLVGKPGGVTTSEACARALPMVLLRPLPGQEEMNAQRLSRLGAAIVEPDPRRAGALALSLISDAGRLSAMREAARNAGRPDSTAAAARIVLDALARRRSFTRGPARSLTGVH